ncbi:hypothetical protein ACF09G_32030 [Streptomyces albogriseolus]|uniref:hypothetical protein n=1 Tax=Streptomyces albogriseolus TaxID=1887 RepID=UPI003702D654
MRTLDEPGDDRGRRTGRRTASHLSLTRTPAALAEERDRYLRNYLEPKKNLSRLERLREREQLPDIELRIDTGATRRS